VNIEFQCVPLLDEAISLVQSGNATGASARNWASYGDAIALPPGTPDWQRMLLTDPQTSGGLLVACASARAESICASIRGAGNPLARIVGSITAGEPIVRIT
jgi:selenide,water dikinase